MHIVLWFYFQSNIIYYIYRISMQIMQIIRAAQNAMFKKWKKYPPKIGVNYHIIYHIMSIADTSWHIDLIYIDCEIIVFLIIHQIVKC